MDAGRLARGARYTRKEDTIDRNRTRINEQIRFSPVRLIDPEGAQLGVVPVEVARENARELGLDLVEVAPDARPPVCRIMDWGRHRFEVSKQEREARRRQQGAATKELKLRPGTDTHDLEVKLRHARRFLRSGSKVKVTLRYRGRELRRPELGRDMLNRVTRALDDVAQVESRSDALENRQLSVLLAPERS